MVAAPETGVHDVLNRVAELVSRADGDHDERLRDELFALTDALEENAADRRAMVASVQFGWRGPTREARDRLRVGTLNSRPPRRHEAAAADADHGSLAREPHAARADA